MGKIKAGLREQVAASTPTYVHYDKIKESLRIDGFGTAATYSELPPLPPVGGAGPNGR
jgi:hypothetical protein